MRLKWNTSSQPIGGRARAAPRRLPAGLTLIEVVAGLALLSTLLVSVLTTRAKLTRQWATAQQRLRATEAADALLTGWWQEPETFPRQAAGFVPGEPGLRWRTRVVPNEPVNRLAASVVRLEVVDDRHARGAGEVLVAVEVVLADKAPPRAASPAHAAGEGGR